MFHNRIQRQLCFLCRVRKERTTLEWYNMFLCNPDIKGAHIGVVQIVCEGHPRYQACETAPHVSTCTAAFKEASRWFCKVLVKTSDWHALARQRCRCWAQVNRAHPPGNTAADVVLIYTCNGRNFSSLNYMLADRSAEVTELHRQPTGTVYAWTARCGRPLALTPQNKAAAAVKHSHPCCCTHGTAVYGTRWLWQVLHCCSLHCA
jgi:hypothetical protein